MAFVESLKKGGWAADGTPIDPVGGQKPLYGTLQLSPEEASIQVGVEQLSKETDAIVAQIVRKQGLVPYSEGTLKSKSKLTVRKTWQKPNKT